MVDVTTAFKNECEANVGTYKFGKVEVNLIDNNPASWEIGEYSSSNGTKIDTANMTRLSSLSKCEPNKQYTISLNNSNFRLRLAYFNASQTYISSSAALTGGTITTPANTRYIGATLWNNANTYTGTNINLQNSTNDKLISYNLEGQIIQDGKSTPTNQLEVKNVKGRNIVRNFSVNSQTSAYATALFIDADLMPNTTYTISFKGTYNNRLYANEALFTTSPYFYVSEGRTTITLTTKDTISQTNTSQRETPISMWKIFKNAQAQSSANVFEDLQMEQGTATPFLPYNTIQVKVTNGTETQTYPITLGKSNLFDKTSTPYKANYYINGTGGEYSNYEFAIYKLQIKPNTKYKILNSGQSGGPGYALYNSNNERVGGENYLNRKEIIFTTTSDTDYILFSVVYSSESYRYDLQYFRLDEEPLDLNKIGDYKNVIRKGTGKNIFDGAKEEGQIDTTTGENAEGSGITRSANYIEVKPNTKYIISNNGSAIAINYFEYTETKSFIKYTYVPSGSPLTTSPTTKFIRWYRGSTNVDKIQIEQGEKVTFYEPNNLKDKWYIEKQIDKVVLNGTESWNIESSGQRYTTLVANSRTETQRLMIYSNYFHYSTGNEVGTGFNYGRYIYIYPNSISSVADLKTWLSTHNTIIYYMLATSTFTEITDENLINQLEAVNNAQLYSGTTNIEISGNLPAIMNIETDLSNNVRDNSAEPFIGFNITGDNDLISFKVTAKADSNGKPFGSVVKKQLDIEVFNENNKYDLENRQVKVSTGLAETTGNFCEWETFNITQTKDTQTKGHAQYTGYDNMVRAATPYIDNIDFGDSGITLYEFANEVVKQLGSTLGNEELPNGDFIITGNPFTNNETLEVVLRQLGELNGSFVEIGRDNKVWFRQIENTLSPMALSTNLYTEDFTKADKFGGVNKVIVGESNIETNAAIESDPTEIAKNGEQLIEVLDNYFMITMEQKEEICSSLWGMLEGFEYYPFKTKYNGFPYIDLGDNLEITDINNNNYLSVVLNYDFTYKGGYLGNVGASALSRTASKYKNNNTLGKQFRKVGIEVDRVDGKITAEVAAREEAIAETKDEVAGNYVATNVFDDYTSTINQTVSGIDTRVSTTETTLYGQNDDGLVKKVETNETNISQNAENISLTVGRVSSVESLAETTEANTRDIVNQFVFGEDGLTISNKGSTSDDMKLNLTNEQIAFLYRNNVVLKINGSVIEFSAASFQKLDLGNYVWQAEEDDSLSLIYEGGNA